MIVRKISRLIFHPIFFGIYPVLYLTGTNLGEIQFVETWRSILLAFAVSVILWSVVGLVIKEKRKAAVLTTFLLISFFSYGHLYNFLGQDEIFQGLLKRHRYLVPFFSMAILVGSWWIMKKAHNLDLITKFFNLMSLVLVIFPVFQISVFEIRSLFLNHENQIDQAIKTDGSSDLRFEYKPDIYYIILDAYSREDILLELFDYDNSAFLKELRAMGFYVADCSTSNYDKTVFSLASSLNMNYIETLEDEILRGGPGTRPDVVKFRSLIKDNEVRKVLEANGYTTVAFQTGFFWTSWDDADYYFSSSQKARGNGVDTVLQNSLNEFEALFIETSALPLFLDSLEAAGLDLKIDNHQNPESNVSRAWLAYNRVNYTLNILEEIPTSVESPKLVFAHIVSPHAPFVFAANGEFVPNQKDVNPGYIHQIIYLNQRVLNIVETILQSSENPPIIIIQADHGSPEMKYTPYRLPILNAYYLPGDGNSDLYASITPVNTFRLVFDQYFGANYGLLDDIARNSTEDDLSNFTIVPNECKSD